MARLLLALLLALVGCLVHDGGGRARPAWQVAAALEPPAVVNLTQLREESLGMFRFGYGEYMRLAFPKDDLRPISCRGKDSQGGIALTLIDSLDTLIVMGEQQRLQDAVRWLAANVTFDVDARVHVFELTIRAVGGLLSAHMLIEQDPTLVPGYDGSLLRLAVDLTDRFMPAFETPTGVPLSWVNLRHGQIPGDVRSTCTACAGTLLLEFGVLSRLTGNATYEAKARHAVETIFAMRSPRGLVGNTLDCDSGAWVRTDAGVGAGVDSFYEYLLKAYLAFGDASYLDMFKEVYAAAMTNLQLDPQWNGHVWLVDVDMQAGQVLHPYVWSLGAFWPGLQALAGQVEEGTALHANWTSAWSKFGWLPEMFDVGMENRHPTETGYPLRPELMESTFLLHAASGDERLLGIGAALHQQLRDRNRVACGYASVGDVSTGQLEDTMESFFLSETVKYLYLLFSNASALVDHFVLSTEGHLLPPFPDTLEEADSEAGALLLHQQRHLNASRNASGTPQPRGGGSSRGAGPPQGSPLEEQQQQLERQRRAQGMCYWSEAPERRKQQEQAGQPAAGGGGFSGGQPEVDERWASQVALWVADKCRHLCRRDQQAATAHQQAAQALHAALPLLPLPPGAPGLLRQRRCTACREVSAAVRHAELAKAHASLQAKRAKEATAAAKVGLSNLPAVAASGLAVNRQFLCVMEDTRRGSLGCGVFKEIPARQIPQCRLNALPQNYMLIQLTDPPAEAQAAAAAAAQQQQQHEPPGCVAEGGEVAEAAVGYQATVEMVLPDGGRRRFEGMLADFGPVFEPGCAEETQDWESGGGGGHSSSSSSDGAGGAEQPAGAPPLPPAQPQHYRGRRLEVREGGAGGQHHRLVYVTDPVEEEDDPYADPDEEEEQQQQQQQASAGASSPGTSSGSRAAGDKAATAAAAASTAAKTAVAEEEEEDEEVYEDGEDDSYNGYTPAGGAAADFPSMVLCSAEAYAAASDPLNACSKLRNAAQLAGRIAVVQRGGCMFVDKALAAQRAGAVGVVVVNTEDQLMAMGTDQQGSQSDVSAVLIPGADGDALLGALHAAAATVPAACGCGCSRRGRPLRRPPRTTGARQRAGCARGGGPRAAVAPRRRCSSRWSWSCLPRRSSGSSTRWRPTARTPARPSPKSWARYRRTSRPRR